MKRIYLFILLFLILTRCDDILTDVDCDSCYVDKPQYGDIIINLSIDSRNTAIPIKLYEGKVDRNILIFEDTVSVEEIKVEVETNKYYSVVAEYNTKNKRIYAVDGGEFNTDLVSGYCDTKCYVYKGGTYNLELKFDDK